MSEINQFHTNLFKDNTIYKLSQSDITLDSIDENITTVIYLPNDCSAEDKTQINKILNACQLDQHQVFMIENNAPWHTIRSCTHIKHIILFDVKPQAIGINIEIPIHFPLSFDERTWIATIHPAQLQADPNAKAALWKNGLKPHFIGN